MLHPDSNDPVDSETVRRLLPLASGDGDDRALLSELLALWAGERAVAGAALYVEDESISPCLATWGEGPFPRHPASVPSSGSTADGAVARTPLAGGVILWRAAPDGEREHAREAGAVAGSTELLLALALANCRLRRRVKRQSFQASYRGVEIEALYDVGLAIAKTLDLEALAEEILIRAVSLLDARRGALYLLDGDGYRLQSRFGGEARESFPLADGESAPADVLPGTEHRSIAPIAIEDDRRGLLVVADKESRTGVGPFSADDERTLALFANQAAIALENARLHREALEKERYERDLQLAAEIQRQILPKGVPELPGFEVAGWNRPAREVGGDFFDFVPLTQDEIRDDVRDASTGDATVTRTGPRLGLALADVSGKGVPAALMVSTLHSAIRLLMGRMGVGPALVERLNRHILASSAANKFITLLVGELDTVTGELVFVNAGHNPGLLIRAAGTVERLPSGGLPVGLLPGSRYRAGRVTLAPGDLVCLYSDGITECVARDDEELGEERLIELLRSVADEPVAEIVKRVEREVTAFADGQEQGDDQTLVLVRRKAP